MALQLLTKTVTEQYCRMIRMPEGATKCLIEITDRLAQDQKLMDVYQDFYTEVIASGHWTTVWEPLTIHPYVEEICGKQASLFYLHAALQRLPITEQRYAERGLGEELFVETLRDISVWVQNCYNLTGHYGIRNFSWIWRHLEAKLFRLGRMQYMAVPFTGDVIAFYHAKQHKLMLLSQAGIELRANGDRQGVCGKEKTADGFVTSYEETEEYVIGHPITPDGKGLRTTVKLPLDEWEKVLDKGDMMLEIHIPRDGVFDMDAIKDSYRQAQQFFATYYPEVNAKGMMCHTWMFTPQLREMLSPSSNIVRFQQQFYLYPTAGSIDFLWKFVFDELTEVQDAKPDNSLRRKVLDYVRDDKEIFDMRGVFLDRLGEFGSVTY